MRVVPGGFLVRARSLRAALIAIIASAATLVSLPAIGDEVPFDVRKAFEDYATALRGGTLYDDRPDLLMPDTVRSVLAARIGMSDEDYVRHIRDGYRMAFRNRDLRAVVLHWSATDLDPRENPRWAIVPIETSWEIDGDYHIGCNALLGYRISEQWYFTEEGSEHIEIARVAMPGLPRALIPEPSVCTRHV